MSLDKLAALAPRQPQSKRWGAFVPFVRDVLKVTLTPAQRVLALVAFDGHDPKDFTGSDRELARRLFGDVNEFPADSRHVLVAVCGARAGKSYVLGALRLLHLALTVSLATLAPGEMAAGLFIAPDIRLAKQALRYALGAAESSPAVAKLIQSKGTEGFVIKRDDGIVSIECLPATRGGGAVRGRSLVGAVLDECAFFRDDSAVVNDADVYKAVSPRVLRGGQVVVASTPWAEAGLLYDFHKRNHGHPTDAISAHAPTLLLRDDEHTRSYVAREEARDPTNARREFGAEFLAVTGTVAFDPRAIDAAIDRDMIIPEARIRGAVVAPAGDFAFRRNASALVIIQRTPQFYRTSLVSEQKPEGGPLKPSRVVADFARDMKPYGADTLTADGHYRESIAEHLEASELYLAPAPEGQTGVADMHQAARMELHEGRCKLPNHARLISQLKAIVAKPQPGGGMSYISPESKDGSHGDVARAWVTAMWRASKEEPANDAFEPARGTADWERAREERRFDKAIEDWNEQQNDGNDWNASNDWIRESY